VVVERGRLPGPPEGSAQPRSRSTRCFAHN